MDVVDKDEVEIIYDEDDIKETYNRGYDEGYEDGYLSAVNDLSYLMDDKAKAADSKWAVIMK